MGRRVSCVPPPAASALGYATTFCDLRNHSVYDVVAGSSEQSLEGYLNKLEGKHLVKMVCMDLSMVYRSLVRKHFPQARIVADRFHVIPRDQSPLPGLLEELDRVGPKNRGLLSLMRRHRHHLKYLRENPAMEAAYRFKQTLCYLLLNKRLNQNKCRELAPKLQTEG